METIELEDEYVKFVDSEVIRQFEARGLNITSRARDLMAFAMQCQVDEEVMKRERLFVNAERILEGNLADFYVRRYGEKTVTFNRAFHLLADVGYVMKFPLVPTSPFS